MGSAHQFAAAGAAGALALPSAMAFSLASIVVTNSARVQHAFALGAEKTPASNISSSCPSDAKVTPWRRPATRLTRSLVPWPKKHVSFRMQAGWKSHLSRSAMAAHSSSFRFRNSSCAAAALRRQSSPCLSPRDGAQADGNVTSQSSVVESLAFALDAPAVLPSAPPLNAAEHPLTARGSFLPGCTPDARQKSFMTSRTRL